MNTIVSQLYSYWGYNPRAKEVIEKLFVVKAFYTDDPSRHYLMGRTEKISSLHGTSEIKDYLKEINATKSIKC